MYTDMRELAHELTPELTSVTQVQQDVRGAKARIEELERDISRDYGPKGAYRGIIFSLSLSLSLSLSVYIYIHKYIYTYTYRRVF